MALSKEDIQLVDNFLAEALTEGPRSDELWACFVIRFAQCLKTLGNGPDSLDRNVKIGSYLLSALLGNFYSGTPDGFYYEPGPLREKMFRLAEMMGLHILPVHFYSPVPVAKELDAKLWSKKSELPGVRMNEQAQWKLLSTFAALYQDEYCAFPDQPAAGAPPYTYFRNNGYYGYLDGAVLYCMIRHFKPRRIYEIGSGNTTYLSAQAILKNAEEAPNYRCELVAFEPYPNEVLRAGLPGLTHLVTLKAQDIPGEVFQKLEENDILFIDSSHVLKAGSDVQYEYLEVLPKLRKGVLIHVHDIFLPMDYPQEWIVHRNRYWTEQYLLQAFLAFNDAFEVVMAGNYLCLTRPEDVKSAFKISATAEIGAGHFWMRKTR